MRGLVLFVAGIAVGVTVQSVVAQNNTGSNTITDNPTSNSSSVISVAGIEATYADIKTTTIPVPSF